MKTIELKCKNCNTNFNYTQKEFNRQTKIGRMPTDFFCGLSCSRRYKNSHRSAEEQQKISNSLSLRNKNNTYAQKGNFTYYLHLIKNRKQDIDIDDEYLTSIWQQQDGKCAISQIPIIHETKRGFKPNSASLDRIDSKKGYVKGNIQFIAYSLNLGKSSFSNEQIIEFVNKLREIS